ncbi:hypothetical protein SNOG_01636 [Parastagonospora nodorum SN15]|uniref:Uncharacterized protein n=1 Tax=Phaeosphaeria nodorum (strain SN15 / ATCC MYA-4574 / FGSC 10173) TaxID=321614 RepID=Q0V2X8_PHANO|nr:hypothetical protein SNOG_01636 [Parastagonospora nodorum SN15]EAT91285.1 hypothetical protein SNOG_01636 [Parastagonospora nodorum SN15]
MQPQTTPECNYTSISSTCLQRQLESPLPTASSIACIDPVSGDTWIAKAVAGTWEENG